MHTPTCGVCQAVRGQRLSRLLQIIALFRGQRSWNVPRLAERFSCSRRNIHRDLAILELAGVPFYYDPQYGEGGGYRIRSGWFFPTVGLTDQECIDLAVLTKATSESGGVPFLDTASDALDKLLSTVHPDHQDVIRAATELFDYLNLPTPRSKNVRQVMVQFQKALLTNRQIRANYVSPDTGRSVGLQLQPRRVFFAGNHWYTACVEAKSTHTKLYQLARFESAETVPIPMDIDREFSLREFLGNAWCVYPGEREWHVEIEFDQRAAPLVVESEWHHTQELVVRDNGTVLFRATVCGLDEIKYWVLRWGGHACVKKPSELVHEVYMIASEIKMLYESSPVNE